MLQLSLLPHLTLHFNHHLLHSTHTLLLPLQLEPLSAAEPLMVPMGQPCFYLIGYSPVNFAVNLPDASDLFIRLWRCYSAVNDFATIEMEGHHW